MSVWQPSEAELVETGSLKWTGMQPKENAVALGAWVAEMDFGTAPAVQTALIKAIKSGLLGYPPPWATEATAQALVPFMEKRYGWAPKAGWVRTFQTVLGALHHTIDHLTRPGSAVVVPTPAYMPFLSIPQTHGREMIPVPALHEPNAHTPEEAWSLDLEGIEAGLAAGAGLVILCDPWNPTGRVFSVAELRALNNVVKKYDALIFADEIHAPIVYGGGSQMVSYASLGPDFADHTITAVGASKAWNVAGLLACQVIIPNEKLRQKWDEPGGRNAPCALGTVAAIAAYEDGEAWLREVLELIAGNLDLLGVALEGTAVDYYPPQGTYLAWLGFEAYDLDRSPGQILLDDFGVATNEGETLGAQYSQWVRVNAAMSPEIWERVVEAIATFAKTAPLKPKHLETNVLAGLDQETFDHLFPQRNPFYTLEGLKEAARHYPHFAASNDPEVALRELAAFLANVSHETLHLRYVTEINEAAHGDYCDPSLPYGCPAGTNMYYGRGPLQLSWNFNYKAAGDALGIPLLENPILVEEDPAVSWATALWYWNTQVGPGNYTCHDAIVGGHGFGETIRTINGPLECDGGNPAQVKSRVELFEDYCNALNTHPGDCLSC